ncbi:MAG: OmpA family protein, partial [Bacteroidota bacterium]
QPEYCPEGDAAAVTPPVEEPATPAVTDNYAIASNLGAGAVLTGSIWPRLRDSLQRAFAADPTQLLNVYGYFYGSEPIPPGYENMGLMRADEIKKLLVAQTSIPADNIVTLAERLDGAPDGDPWDPAGFFAMRAQAAAEAESEIIQLGKDEIDILFPFSSSTKDVDPEVDAYLSKLAQRLQQTEETVVLTGHTDDVSSNEFNMGLGQRRADFVKQILVRNGAPANRITTRSRGEEDPRVPNTTEANRHQNRRVNVKLNAQ